MATGKDLFRIRSLALGMVILLGFHVPVRANMAAADILIDSVDVVAEPWCTSNWRVLEEQLSIDLTRVGENGLAYVEAVYKVQTDSVGNALDLVFVAAQHYGDSLWVYWNGERMKVERLDSVPMAAAAFALPVSTPDLTGGATGFQEGEGWGMKHRKTAYFRFQMGGGSLQAQEIKVRYVAQAAHIQPDYGYINDLWQLAYSLSPAKTWGDFGTLNVEVTLPDGFGMLTNLDLKAEENAFRGSFEGIPADHLLMSFGLGEAVTYTYIVTFNWLMYLPLALVSLGFLVFFVRRRWRKNKSNGPAVAWMILSILFWSVGWFLISMQSILLADKMLDGAMNQNFIDSSTYGGAFAVILGFIPALLIFSALHLGVYALIRWWEKSRAQRRSMAA